MYTDVIWVRLAEKYILVHLKDFMTSSENVGEKLTVQLLWFYFLYIQWEHITLNAGCTQYSVKLHKVTSVKD